MTVSRLFLSALSTLALLSACGGDDSSTVVETCANAETLPETVDADLTVGPGCIRINRTSVSEGATLTIAAGTRVLMAPAGFLSISPFGENSSLVAVGTAEAPIVFTSDAADPRPGDWQCVRVAGGSSASDLRFVTFEYGGEACDATGAGLEGMLQLNAAARDVSNNTFRHSLTHGVSIQTDGNVRGFSDNQFADNGQASLVVAAPQLLTLGEGLTFADTDDYIEVDDTFALQGTGTWLGQPVPFRVVGNLDIDNGGDVTIGAGVRIELSGASISVFAANLSVEGTAANPVVFTSFAATPAAGDWGCITYASSTGVARFDHAVFEYAGSGAGCSGATYNTALNAPATAVVTNSTFRNVAGSAIRTFDACDAAAWCMNTFESVAEGPLDCDNGTLTSCP
jgi:hypothetical protein